MFEALASDLYLLERWKAFPERSPADRRDQIFNEFVALGATGRRKYHQALVSGEHIVNLQKNEDLLLQIRSPTERSIAKSLSCGDKQPWFRTSYKVNSILEDLDDDEIHGLTGDESKQLVLDDETRYVHEPWTAIFRHFPEAVESYVGCRGDHSKQIAEAKDAVQLDLEEAEDEEAKAEIRESIQHACVTGCLWVEDDESRETGEVQLIWLDEYGRIVRSNRVGDVTEYLGMLLERKDDECDWWLSAEVGDSYEDGNWP